MADIFGSSSAKASVEHSADVSPSSSVTHLISRYLNPEVQHHASLQQIGRLSNWQVHMYEELIRALSMMERLPEGHDLHLKSDVASRAVEVLARIRSSTHAEAPRIINEEGETVLFTWDTGSIKKYVCVDGSDVEIEARRKGMPFVASEIIGQDKSLDIEKLVEFLGVRPKSSATY